MMSSLVPGSIFYTSGLNRKSTPTPANVTPSELDQRYKRTDFDGREWPHDSPVSRSYDVGNTSTKLILLNNKYGQGSTRLRGYYTGPSTSSRFVDPNRHGAKSPRNLDLHTACYDSSSPKFEPKIKTDLEWVNTSVRPPNSLIAEKQTGIKRSSQKLREKRETISIDNKPEVNAVDSDDIGHLESKSPVLVKKGVEGKSSVNPKRHTSCIVPSTPIRLPGDRPHSRMSMPPARYFSEFTDLSVGEKIYLWSIEKIYNIENMKNLKQDQYKKLLQLEAKKGNFGYRDYEKYMRYIESARSRSHGTGSPSDKRAKSAYSYRSGTSGRTSSTKLDKKDDKEDDKSEQSPRPQTSVAKTREQSPNDNKSRSQSANSDGRKSVTSSKKSPTPSRKSSARSTRSIKSLQSIYSNKSNNSMKSNTRSKASSRASSAKSAKSVKSTGSKGSNSDASSRNEEKMQTSEKHHREGQDRPKSRLGHPENRDTDKDSIHSSISSIYSDKYDSSEDSGVGNVGNDKKKNQKTKQADSSSNSSQDKHTGSRTSLKSDKSSGKSSIRSSDDQKADNASRDVTIHRVPSAGYIKPELDTDKEETEDEKDKKEEKTPETKTDHDSKIQQKETDQFWENSSSDSHEKNESLSGTNIDKTEEKADEKRHAGVWESAGDQSGETDDTKQEKSETRPKLGRQDSFDEEDDDDRRVNKDIDKIEN